MDGFRVVADATGLEARLDGAVGAVLHLEGAAAVAGLPVVRDALRERFSEPEVGAIATSIRHRVLRWSRA